MGPAESPQPPTPRSRLAVFFSTSERLVLFLLSLTIGLVDLVIALSVAAYMGVIPRKKVDDLIRAAQQKAPFLRAYLVTPLDQKRGKRH